jgi:hypothetical protein
LEKSKAGPFDKRDKDINPIGRGHFLPKLVFELWIVAGSSEQTAGG